MKKYLVTQTVTYVLSTFDQSEAQECAEYDAGEIRSSIAHCSFGPVIDTKVEPRYDDA